MPKYSQLHLLFCLPVLGLLFLQAAVIAAPGVLDTRFNETGVVVTRLSEGVSEGLDAVVQPDGKLLVAGFRTHPVTGQDAVCLRYESDGSLDSTFGADGQVVFSRPHDDTAQRVALYPDGKIVLAGRHGTEPSNRSEFGVYRLNADGTPDITFNRDGFVSVAIDAYGSVPQALAVLPDGHILIGGVTDNPGLGSDFVLIRLNSAGELDTNFGSAGRTVVNVGDHPVLNDMVVQADGKMVVCGSGLISNKNHAVLLRFNADGLLDSDFGQEGKTAVLIGTYSTTANAVVIQGDGKIVTTGDFREFGNFSTKVCTLRYHADGSIDPSFGLDGSSVADSPRDNVGGKDVVIASDGKLMICCSSSTLGGNSALLRLNADGSIDTSLGESGYVFTSWEINRDMMNALVTQGDDRWTMVGSSDGEFGRQMTLLRYITSPAQIKIVDDENRSLSDQGTMLFKGVAPGYSRSRSFTISNTGGDSLEIWYVDTDGDGFSISEHSTELLLPNCSMTFQVTFAPGGTLAGLRSAKLHLRYELPGVGEPSRMEVSLTGPLLSASDDADSDGLNDVTEFKLESLGFDPMEAQPELVAALFGNLQEAKANLNAEDYYASAQIQDLHVNARILKRDAATGEVLLTLGVQKSASLKQFETLPLSAPAVVFNEEGLMEFRFTAAEDAAFFRVVSPAR